MSNHEHDPFDHEVDGIRELDNALPKWWLYGFYVTIGIGVAYFFNFHVLSTPVVGQTTLVAEYLADVEAARLLRPAAVTDMAAFTVRTDADSLAKGDAIFHGQTNACFACHRDDLGGMIGPNLTDAFWMHGCAPSEIARSIATGFPDKGMQPFGTAATLSPDSLTDLVSYILSKSGSMPPNPKALEPDRDKTCSTPDAQNRSQGAR